VEDWKEILMVLEQTLFPQIGKPAQPSVEKKQQGLNISVIFTSAEPTLAALRKAGTMATSLGARITLLVPQVVPYPLPLESPPVLLDWTERRSRAIANESPVETIVRLYLCRDRMEGLETALRPKSIVVMGDFKRYWPFTFEKRLAKKLRRAGHEVILTETE